MDVGCHAFAGFQDLTGMHFCVQWMFYRIPVFTPRRGVGCFEGYVLGLLCRGVCGNDVDCVLGRVGCFRKTGKVWWVQDRRTFHGLAASGHFSGNRTRTLHAF